MTSRNKRTIGTEYEEKAATYLKQQGLSILEKNFRNRFGEIDLIGKDGNYLVFIEVKYRFDEKKGLPMEAVSFRKQKTICKVSDYYRMLHQIPEETGIRFDVVSIENNAISWYKNAFDYIG
ncbi:MAG: YraN family protein [Lachnospiraceae bacterium]|nr:YraN family protein [Lachnospiraceae bacterium]